jgi:hypothetical protein
MLHADTAGSFHRVGRQDHARHGPPAGEDPAGEYDHEAGKRRGGPDERNLLHQIQERRYKFQHEPPCFQGSSLLETDPMVPEARVCLQGAHGNL